MYEQKTLKMEEVSIFRAFETVKITRLSPVELASKIDELQNTGFTIENIDTEVVDDIVSSIEATNYNKLELVFVPSAVAGMYQEHPRMGNHAQCVFPRISLELNEEREWVFSTNVNSEIPIHKKIFGNLISPGLKPE